MQACTSSDLNDPTSIDSTDGSITMGRTPTTGALPDTDLDRLADLIKASARTSF
jgi:hypothetical protein